MRQQTAVIPFRSAGPRYLFAAEYPTAGDVKGIGSSTTDVDRIGFLQKASGLIAEEVDLGGDVGPLENAGLRFVHSGQLRG